MPARFVPSARMERTHYMPRPLACFVVSGNGLDEPKAPAMLVRRGTFLAQQAADYAAHVLQDHTCLFLKQAPASLVLEVLIHRLLQRPSLVHFAVQVNSAT